MNLLKKKEVAAWLKKTAESMHKKDSMGCASLFLDKYNHDFSLSVGWLGGYDPKEADTTKDFHSKSQPEYALNAEIVKYNPADCSDLEWMEMPYDEKTGEVWNTGNTLCSDCDWLGLADYYLKEFKAIVEAEEAKNSEAEEAAA